MTFILGLWAATLYLGVVRLAVLVRAWRDERAGERADGQKIVADG
jgi:hypothetical protein